MGERAGDEAFRLIQIVLTTRYEARRVRWELSPAKDDDEALSELPELEVEGRYLRAPDGDGTLAHELHGEDVRVVCLLCEGAGDAHCSRCDGRGEIKYEEFNDKRYRHEKCVRCGGRGRVDCADCKTSGVVHAVPWVDLERGRIVRCEVTEDPPSVGGLPVGLRFYLDHHTLPEGELTDVRYQEKGEAIVPRMSGGAFRGRNPRVDPTVDALIDELVSTPARLPEQGRQLDESLRVLATPARPRPEGAVFVPALERTFGGSSDVGDDALPKDHGLVLGLALFLVIIAAMVGLLVHVMT